MSRSLKQQSFTPEDEWEDKRMTQSTNSTFTHYNAIFSDDEDDQPQGSFSRWFSQQNSDSHISSSTYTDPVLSSSTYHIHQADNALVTLKHVVNEKEGWKKALKHKSGVMVHMKNGLHKGDKTPIFKGEAIIQGFTPQAIFYVVGMRKLWDEQYEDGNLVENLNDTTSLTYEVMKPTATSKSRDLSLVEKIECTQNGAIVFACTSVESPRIPRISGKTRVNIKLQGWILEPLHGSPHPATKVTFVIQESMKGWVPGFAKKSLARRPLVISKVAEYLEKKTERMKQQQQQQKKPQSFLSIHHGSSRRPSVMNNNSPQLQQRSIRSDTQQSILVTPEPTLQAPKKHISFADHDTIPVKPPTPIQQPKPQPKIGGHLYPSHRHPIQKVESIQLLKKLTYSLDNWTLSKELDDGVTKYYQFSNSFQFSDDEDNPFIQQQNRIKKREDKRKIPFIRADSVIEGWTAEQLCSVIQCFGSRKIWDSLFEGGRMIDRFSQKEYLVQWFLGGMLPIASVDLSAITSIETDPITGTVYTATTSVTDQQIPPDESGHRIRAYTDLYGWVFKPQFDKQGRTLSVHVKFVCNMDFRYVVPDHIMQSWVDNSLQSIQHLHHYLTQYGCPPYIRRVAGKVVQEDFDTLTNHYQIVYTAKHQPSSSYRARKQNQANALWCTDVRFHQTMFPHGLNILVQPDHVARVQVSFSQKSIKVFTTDEKIDGQQVTLTLIPLSEHQHGFSTYRYNGEWFYSQKSQKKIQVVEDIEDKGEGLISEPTTPVVENIVDGQASISSTSTTVDEPSTPPISVAKTKADDTPTTKTTTTADVAPGNPVPTITSNTVDAHTTITARSETDVQPETERKPDIPVHEVKEINEGARVQEEVKHEETTLNEALKVPEGYLLVPEHQNSNIIMITDELSFNSQQLSVIFIAMVICYYMGKFTSCNC